MQVQSSLRWFVDNFSTIADWRATLLRVAGFRRALIECDVLHDTENRIAFVDGDPGKIRIDDLEIASPAGATMLKEKKIEIDAGERVLIVGEAGTGKTLLFRALAGLWPWGAGKISRPPGERIVYMPRTPYLPPGSLREVLAYPSAVADFDTAAYTRVLNRLKLERLLPLLDTPQRWEVELNEDEQQAVALARVLLHDPPWLFIDEVLDSLDDNTRQSMLEVFAKDLPRTGIVHIGRKDARDHLFSRVLHLVKDPSLRKLRRRAAPVPA
jgi:putative ATP-binding cassette transporter